MVENSTFSDTIDSKANETELYEFLETNYEEIVIFTEDYTFVSGFPETFQLALAR